MCVLLLTLHTVVCKTELICPSPKPFLPSSDIPWVQGVRPAWEFVWNCFKMAPLRSAFTSCIEPLKEHCRRGHSEHKAWELAETRSGKELIRIWVIGVLNEQQGVGGNPKWNWWGTREDLFQFYTLWERATILLQEQWETIWKALS